MKLRIEVRSLAELEELASRICGGPAERPTGGTPSEEDAKKTWESHVRRAYQDAGPIKDKMNTRDGGPSGEVSLVAPDSECQADLDEDDKPAPDEVVWLSYDELLTERDELREDVRQANGRGDNLAEELNQAQGRIEALENEKAGLRAEIDRRIRWAEERDRHFTELGRQLSEANIRNERQVRLNDAMRRERDAARGEAVSDTRDRLARQHDEMEARLIAVQAERDEARRSEGEWRVKYANRCIDELREEREE